MKKTGIVFILVLCVLCFCACGSTAEAPAAEKAGQQESAKAKASAAEICAGLMALQKDPVEMMAVEKEMLLDFYGISPEDVADGAFFLSVDNLRADEFAVVTAAGDDAADRLEQQLKDRMSVKYEEANGYSPEQAAIIKNSGVVREGRDLALICSKDYESIREAYRNMIR